jgi:hypothetical protein
MFNDEEESDNEDESDEDESDEEESKEDIPQIDQLTLKDSDELENHNNRDYRAFRDQGNPSNRALKAQKPVLLDKDEIKKRVSKSLKKNYSSVQRRNSSKQGGKTNSKEILKQSAGWF